MTAAVVDAIVFDLDGTLADTLDDIARSLNAVLARYGLPEHPVPSYRALVGEGVRNLVERAVPDASGELRAELVAAFRVHYAEHLLDTTALYDGVPELLDALTARGVPMAVLSNKPHDMTLAVARALLARWRMSPVLGRRDHVPRKPDPAGALEIANALGIPAERCALVGDTRTDMQTALAAGMVPVGVLWGFREADELRAHGALHVFEHPADLLALLS